MGAFEGTLTFKTFFVDGEPPNDYMDAYLAKIGKLAFRDLEPEDEEDRRIGWVCARRPLDTDFNRPKVFWNQFVTLSLRIDKWSIPGALLKAHVERAMRDTMEEQGIERMDRRQKDDIKDFVTKQLKRRLVPSMKIVDFTWDVHARVVRFWTHSATLCEEFQELFEETFGMQLVPDSPYTAAMDLDFSEDDLDKLARIEPEWFGDPAGV